VASGDFLHAIAVLTLNFRANGGESVARKEHGPVSMNTPSAALSTDSVKPQHPGYLASGRKNTFPARP
jgi:hypothetical protein